MTVQELTDLLHEWAPRQLQESYDNSGLIVGSPSQSVNGVLVSLDCTEDVVSEAIEKDCNVIVSHHPIIFKGLKSLTGANYVERTVLKAIKNDIVLIAVHTNLDNIMSGVNRKIAEKLELQKLSILQPKQGLLRKLTTYIPQENVAEVQKALFAAGAGKIGDYDSCGFKFEGTGSFRPLEGSQPYIGTQNELHEGKEVQFSCVFNAHLQSKIVTALNKSHPYEEVAYDIVQLENTNMTIGAGMMGKLNKPLKPDEFLSHVKSSMGLSTFKYTDTSKETIENVAICGGSGSFLIPAAKAAKVDAYITGDIKYHEFFDGEDNLAILDIGHYESERFTIELIAEYLKEKITTFAIRFSETNTNPVKYYT